jgi:surface protein
MLEQLRQQSLQARAQALSEQARNRSAISPPIPSAAGASGGGGGTNCLPPGGLMLTLDLSIFEQNQVFKIFLSEIGIENGKTLYANYTVGSERGQEFESWYVVSWNSDTSLWEFSQAFPEGEGIQKILGATSPDLYNSEWTMLTEEFPPFGTSPGTEFSCDWRYCVTLNGDGFSLTSSAYASWNEISLTEPPNVYSLGEAGNVFWSPEDSSWVTIPGETPILLGGTRDALPTGTIDVGEGGTVIINTGVCAVEPLPVPPPPPEPGEGLTITGDLSGGIAEFAITKIFLSEIGTENGKPLYAVSFSVNGGYGEFGIWLKVAWNSDTSLWEFSQIFSEDSDIDGFVYATSPDLYNDEWTPTEDFLPIGTSPGGEYANNWKYCVTVDGSAVGFTSTGSYQASWFDASLTEPPNVYLSGGFEGASGAIPFFWDTELSSWAVGFPDGKLNFGSLGGTRDALPIGTFNIAFDPGGDENVIITIRSGVCKVEPLPVPAPPIPPSTVPFIIRVDTTLGNGLDSFAVGADTKAFLYNYDVAWEEVGNPGNSGTVTGQTESAVISFPSSGQYDISISGLFPAYRASTGGADSSANKVIDIIQWGNNEWQSMDSAFNNCQNLSNYLATDAPDLSSVTNMRYMFNGARLFNGDISGWDVSSVTNMDNMFYNAQAFNQDLSGWCVSLIPFEPFQFDDNAVAWFLPKPVWGTCP